MIISPTSRAVKQSNIEQSKSNAVEQSTIKAVESPNLSNSQKAKRSKNRISTSQKAKRSNSLRQSNSPQQLLYNAILTPYYPMAHKLTILSYKLKINSNG